MKKDEETKRLYQILFRKLKQAIYYEPDLVQQIDFSEYETTSGIQEKVITVIKYFNSQNESKIQLARNQIDKWIDKITYYIQPKRVEETRPKDVAQYLNDPVNYKSFEEIEPKDMEQSFSNITRTPVYFWKDVNYIFKIPIPLLILDIWWCSWCGPVFDQMLGECCYGSRLYKDNSDESNKQNTRLFKKYIDQYNSWRLNAVSTAKNALDQGKYVSIYSLDFSKYYYSVDIEFDKLRKEWFLHNRNKEIDYIFVILTDVIEKIHKKCSNVFCEYGKYTHKQININLDGDDVAVQHKILPIGLFSSKILANWYLKEFDEKLLFKLRPAYYGRYVDDLLIVFAQQKYQKDDIPLKNSARELDENFDTLFVNTGLFSSKKNTDSNKITEGENSNDNITYSVDLSPYPKCRLRIQNKKIKNLQFDPEFSDATLELLEKNIRGAEKAFTYFPENDLTHSIQDDIFGIIFDKNGSNKIRSIERIELNPTTLSILIAKQSFNMRISGETTKLDKDFIKKLRNDLRGVTYLEYQRSWEKLFTLLVFSEDTKAFADTYNEIKSTINTLQPKIDGCNAEEKAEENIEEMKKLEEFNNKVIADIEYYLDCSAGLALSLLSPKKRNSYLPDDISGESLNSDNNPIILSAKLFREAHMFRQHHVSYPLLSYLKGYNGDLCGVDVFDQQFPIEAKGNKKNAFELDFENLQKSPRFIHNHEFQLFYAWQYLKKYGSFVNGSHSDSNYIATANTAYKNQHRLHDNDICQPSDFSTSFNIGNVSPKKIIVRGDAKPLSKIRVGLVNLPLNENWITDNLNPLRKQNTSAERWQDLAKILNCAIKEKCNLLIFPECSVPAKWLAPLTLWSREHQIAIIFGMEHIISSSTDHMKKKFAYNVTAALLPYQKKNLYKSCCISLRLKNHYSPAEKGELEKYHLNIPDVGTAVYYYYNWRQTLFSVYNCFELADIQHRALFKSYLDFITVCSYNRDVTYFYDIIESLARDLHCYVIYSNDSKYGCSKLIQPKKNEYRDMVSIGGGKNAMLLVGELDIVALSEFQCKSSTGCKIDNPDEFKPLPPGFELVKVRERYPPERERKLEDRQATFSDFKK